MVVSTNSDIYTDTTDYHSQIPKTYCYLSYMISGKKINSGHYIPNTNPIAVHALYSDQSHKLYKEGNIVPLVSMLVNWHNLDTNLRTTQHFF